MYAITYRDRDIVQGGPINGDTDLPAKSTKLIILCFVIFSRILFCAKLMLTIVCARLKYELIQLYSRSIKWSELHANNSDNVTKCGPIKSY